MVDCIDVLFCTTCMISDRGGLARAVFHNYENEAEAAHGRKHERWTEANDLVNQMGKSETTRFSSMQDKCAATSEIIA